LAKRKRQLKQSKSRHQTGRKLSLVGAWTNIKVQIRFSEKRSHIELQQVDLAR